MCSNLLEEDIDAVENIINLQYVANAHPQVLERFIKKLREFKNETNRKTKIREIVENIVGSESENAERLINDLQNRINKIYHLIQGLEPVKERLHRE